MKYVSKGFLMEEFKDALFLLSYLTVISLFTSNIHYL